MDWLQVLTIIGSLGGFMMFMLSRIDSDVKEIREDMKAQGKRTDQLYQMFVDLLKDRKP